LQAEEIASGSNILELGLSVMFTNIITIALGIFVSLPASVATGVHNFSVAKTS
jgi:hypothetical protein